MLGNREPEHYGHMRLEDINNHAIEQGRALNHTITTFQSNAEHELIDRIHQAQNERVDIIIINPAAFTHTSVALRDALLCVAIPFIEVHLSNIYRREPFRQHSYFSDIAIGVISGFGKESYVCAIHAGHHYLQNSQTKR